MNFEAGALSKTVENAYVCPFLIDLQRSDVKPPLSKFQSTQPVERDVLKLVSTLNRAVKASGDKGRRDEPSLEEAFRHWWPHLQASLEHLPDDDDAPNRRRSDREILEEVLGLLRKQDRNNLPVTGYEFDSRKIVPRSFLDLPRRPDHFGRTAEDTSNWFRGAEKSTPLKRLDWVVKRLRNDVR
jgi:hypothetical protein